MLGLPVIRWKREKNETAKNNSQKNILIISNIYRYNFMNKMAQCGVINTLSGQLSLNFNYWTSLGYSHEIISYHSNDITRV